MLTLPYDFDTTTSWQQIVKITAAIVAALMAAIIAAAAMGSWGAAAGIAVCVAMLGFVVRRAARFPGLSFGAVGRLTTDAVETRPVAVYGIPLRVPAGRFAIDRFTGVRVVQRIIVIRPSGSRSNEDIGSVSLVGRTGTPDIEIMFGPIGAAKTMAGEVASRLGLAVERTAAPGGKVVEVNIVN
ncbi:MAG TPA: hypothetical protein VN651_00800 [Gemmatimonadaceae bacterium]|nr:hypothetical protein [Gemmatimonadaceae bacterium]